MNCECGRIAERNGKCATCNFEARKAERQAGKEKKPIRKIKPMSDKRATQNAQYLKLRKQYLEAYPCCEVRECHKKSTEIHHQAGREGERLLDTNYFLAVCHDHHHKITVDSQWAINEGYSVLRTTVKL